MGLHWETIRLAKEVHKEKRFLGLGRNECLWSLRICIVAGSYSLLSSQ